MLPSATKHSNVEKSNICTDLVKRRDLSIVPLGFWTLGNAASTTNSSNTESEIRSEFHDEFLIFDEDLNNESYLLNLDPKNWKEQDHYRVLGLAHLRYKASEIDIKKAFKQKVLKHHPDKRRNAGETISDGDDDYFSCITKANEILSNSVKRRAYDSVDPYFDDDIPSICTRSKEKFFEIFRKVFERNSRWSNKQPAPSLGNDNSTYEEVDEFYSFWYDFDSWREYSYLDEEEKEKAENREERRWIEKQNKAVRQKRKKEETSRIRTLVDNAYACDPRIQRFKENERQKKLAQKQAKIDAARAKAEQEEKHRLAILEIERLKKQQEEAEARQQAEEARKQREALKQSIKKEKKALWSICQENNYFGINEVEVIKHMEDINKICESFTLERLQKFNELLTSSDDGKARQEFLNQVQILNAELEKEKEEMLMAAQKKSVSTTTSICSKNWNSDDLQLLIKAVNLFPAGTNSRWEVIANFINHHSKSGQPKTAKDVVNKTKDLKKLDSSVKEEINKNAYSKFEKSQRISSKDSLPSQRFETPAEQQGFNVTLWTPEEQKLLEQALKTYSASESDRWDKIAECIPNRSKKDCMKRYKDLVELVKAKKAAQAEVSSKSKK